MDFKLNKCAQVVVDRSIDTYPAIASAFDKDHTTNRATQAYGILCDVC